MINEKLMREMVKSVLLEGPMEKMSNMGVPEAIAKFIIDMTPGGCKDHAHWFAQQFKATLHQWDEYIADYKSANKKAKKLDKLYVKKGIKFGTPEHDEHSKLVEPFYQQEKQAIANLKRVLEPMKSSVELICQWATETGVDISKKKTAELDTGETDAQGRQVMTRVPFDLATAEKMATQHFGIQQGTTFMKFPDGWTWLDREVNYCSMESKLMGHCGRTDNNKATLWSLRDPQGMPHMTLEVETDDGERKVYQVMGKGNSVPDDELLPYLWKLFTNPKFNMVRFQKSQWGGLKWDMVPAEVQQKVEEINEDFDASGKSFEEAVDEASDQLNSAMEEVDDSIQLEHFGVSWEIDHDGADDYNFEEEGRVYLSAMWSAAVANIYIGTSVSDSSLRGLKEHLGTYGFDTNGFEARSSYRSINIEVMDTEAGVGTEYEYRSFLETVKSEWDDNWDVIVREVFTYLYLMDVVDKDDLDQEGIDLGLLPKYKELDGWDVNVSGGAMELEKRIVVDVERPLPQLPREIVGKAESAIFEKIKVGLGDDFDLLDEQYVFDDFGCYINTQIGKSKLWINCGVKFAYSESSAEAAGLSVMDADDEKALSNFIRWVNAHQEQIGELAKESILSEEIEDPFDPNIVPKNLIHVEAAMKHAYPDMMSRWQLKNSYNGIVAISNHYYHPDVFEEIKNGLRVVDGFYRHNYFGGIKLDVKQPNFSPAPGGDSMTLGEYVREIHNAIKPHDDLYNEVVRMIGAGPTPDASTVQRAWSQLPKSDAVSESLLRTLVRKAIQ